MRSSAIRLSAIASLCAIALAACSDNSPAGPGGTPRPEATVIKDTAVLRTFMQAEGNVPIPVVLPASLADNVHGADLASTVSLSLRSSVAPPVVSGQTLEATDVAFSEGSGNEKYAYVAYSKRGEATLGAVDVIRISSRSNPRLEGRVTFTDTDIFSLAVAGGQLFLTGMTSSPTFTERAVLEVVRLDSEGNLPSTYSSTRVQLPSFAGTAVHVQNGKVWVTSGTGGPNTGGLSVYSTSTLQLLDRVTLTDARGVAGDSVAGVVVVMQGTPGRAAVFSHTTNRQLGTTLDIGGATIPEARGDVAVNRNWAFLAASNGGVKVLRVDGTGGSIRGTGIARPVVAGLDSTLSTVNGIAGLSDGVDSWLFTANGEAGVYAYFSNHPVTAATGIPSIRLLGRLSFPSSISANFVRVDREGKNLFVASGLGGLRIVDIN